MVYIMTPQLQRSQELSYLPRFRVEVGVGKWQGAGGWIFPPQFDGKSPGNPWVFSSKYSWLVLDGFNMFQPTPLKPMKVTWDDDIHNMWKKNIDVPKQQAVRWCGIPMPRVRMLFRLEDPSTKSDRTRRREVGGANRSAIRYSLQI